jgi:signal transduction histidine kinase
MSTLRARVIAALVGTVVLAVAGAAVLSVGQVTARLEAEVASRSLQASQSLEAELTQAAQVLDGELRKVFAERAASGTAARYLWARGRIEVGRLEVLKILDDRGAILTSGHWPASVGFLDPGAPLYRESSGSRPRFVLEAVPEGEAPSLQRWERGRWSGRDVVAVVGRSLDDEALERIRARLGVGVLLLCPDDRTPCSGATREDLVDTVEGVALSVLDGSALSLQTVLLGPEPDGPRLVIGVDRGRIDRITRALRLRAALLALGGALLVIIPGGLFAARITRPIEALARQAESLAQGDFGARVEATPGVEEVDALVRAFNRMAEDIERGRTRLVQAERVAAWREIAQGLAHELRNPLTPILGAMDVIRRAYSLGRDDFDEILQEQASAVVDEVMRLKELSDSFARFARLPDPSPEDVDVATLLDGLVALYATEITVLRSWTDHPQAPRTVFADPTQLRTALSNLVKNAAEAMDGAGTLRLGIHTGEDEVEITVQDDGAGIPEPIRDRLFTPYFTTKGSRGTGLGLALVHRIVVEHGGSVSAENAPEGGARFTVTLPRRSRRTTAPAPRDSAPGTTESPPPSDPE